MPFDISKLQVCLSKWGFSCVIPALVTDPGTVWEAEAKPTKVWEGYSDFHL